MQRVKAETRATWLVGKNRNKRAGITKWQIEREGVMDTFNYNLQKPSTQTGFNQWL